MTKNLIKKKPLNKDILVKLDKNEIEEIISKYPSNRKSSAVLPLLHLVQKKLEVGFQFMRWRELLIYLRCHI